MKPIRRTECVETVYYDCGMSEHRHRAENTAARCIAAQERKKHARPVHHWNYDDYMDVLAMRESGCKFREIGVKYLITAGRARQVYEKALRLRKKRVISDFMERAEAYRRENALLGTHDLSSLALPKSA